MEKTKMSKSQGSYFVAKDFIENYGGNTLRMLLLKSRYSEDIEVNKETITQAVSRITRIENVIKKISFFFYLNNYQEEKPTCSRKEEILSLLLDNLQTSKVINILEESIGFINKEIDKTEGQAELKTVIDNFLFILRIMGFSLQVRKYSSETKIALHNWKEFLKKGEYEKADYLRQALQRSGIL